MWRGDVATSAPLSGQDRRFVMSTRDFSKRAVASQARLATLMIVAAWGLACLLACAAAHAQAGRAQQPAARPEARKNVTSPEARARIRKAIAAVGLILVRNAEDPPDRRPRPRGSAVVVRQDGIVVTNYHVITRDKSDRFYDEIFFRLSADDGATAASSGSNHLEVMLADKSLDLALLRIRANPANPAAPASPIFPAIQVADSRAVQMLDEIFIIGYPEKGGASVTVNTGLVEGIDTLGNWIKTDARLIHGNSGGAAVNSEGKLVGIPSKVEVDRQPVDKDGDGFPDDFTTFGAVGFLRPAQLIEPMLARLHNSGVKQKAQSVKETSPAPATETASAARPASRLTVRGVIRSAFNEKPIAGARVGLVPLGVAEVTATNLLTWGGTNSSGEFELNHSVPPGRYTLKARAIGYDAFSLDVEINDKAIWLVIALRPR
jgi:S1-C subfamily serine protease